MLLGTSSLIKVTPGLMIWTLICFAITFFVLRKYAFGPIQKMIDERRERIRRTLEEADNAREEARRLLEEHRSLVAQARAEVAELTLVATAKVTGKVLDASDQRRLIDEAIGELDFSVLERND